MARMGSLTWSVLIASADAARPTQLQAPRKKSEHGRQRTIVPLASPLSPLPPSSFVLWSLRLLTPSQVAEPAVPNFHYGLRTRGSPGASGLLVPDRDCWGIQSWGGGDYWLLGTRPTPQEVTAIGGLLQLLRYPTTRTKNSWISALRCDCAVVF